MFSAIDHLKLQSRRNLLKAIGASGAVTLAGTAAQATTVAPPHAAGAAEGWWGKMKATLPARAPGAGEGGSLASFDAASLPLLKGVTMRIQTIAPSAAREPHWHDEASELNFVLEGKGEIGIQEPGGRLVRVPIERGSATYIPAGLLHYILNTGETPLRLIIGFNRTEAVAINLSSLFSAFDGRRLAQSLGVKPEEVPLWPKEDATLYTVPAKMPAPDAKSDNLVLGHTASVNVASLPATRSDAGTAVMVGSAALPGLDGISLKYYEVAPGTMRDLHWHPGAHELSYVESGSLEFGMMAPGSSAQTDVFSAQAGDIVNVPAGWLHYIANTGSGPARFCVYWSRANTSSAEVANVFATLPLEMSLASAGGAGGDLFKKVFGRQVDGSLR